ncbi:MAG TPA: N-acetylmuramoyl-L-alanine amidase [Bacteroidales bacterium]|nr:N-acetylmuramoyl-L-alanine amidase [Bacteroidales bacterium]
MKQSLQKNHKIVIDAGHGGHDPGAIGKNSKEKDITLAIAIKLGEKIKQAYKNVEVIYTRKNDVFVELYKRAKIANENQAELFISIHCNSSKNLLAYGTESWVMGLHKSEENLAVAKKENSAILLEDDYLSKYDGFDPNSPEANAIFSLYQNAYLEQSLIFASLIQKHFRTSLKRCDRGIKQAGFLVLYRTTMPGVLIETGFISNPDEEKYLSSEKGQNNIATAICNAFIEYWANINGINPEDNDIADKFNFIEEIVDKDTTSNKNNTTDVNNIKNNTDIITFKVQFATSSTKKSLNSPEFKDLENVSVYFHQGIYKYTVGDLNNLEDAINLQKEMINKGYKDAFVVAFKNNERISPSEAVKLLKKD